MHFKLFNIPVTIQPTFWVFLLIFCCEPKLQPWQMFLLAFVLIFSLLFHEYGHALAARKLGCTPAITLEGFGGYASYDGKGVSEKHQFIITLCGPLFTALLIGLSYFLFHNPIFHGLPLRYFLYYIMHLNIYWLITNLAPLSPLDGGKITEYLFKNWFGADKGRRFNLILGNIVAPVGAGYFLFMENYLFTYLFLFHGWQNFQTYKAEYARRTTSPFNRYNEALLALENNELAKAQILLEKLTKSKDEYIQILSIEALANLFDRQSRGKEAYKILTKVPPEQLNRGKWLLCKLAYLHGHYQVIQQFSMEIYHIEPTFETALLNAKAFSQLKCPDDSIGWLQTALQFEEAKTQEITLLLADSAFAPMQNYAPFTQLKEIFTIPQVVYEVSDS